jgi:chemotaxis protein CheZ
MAVTPLRPATAELQRAGKLGGPWRGLTDDAGGPSPDAGTCGASSPGTLCGMPMADPAPSMLNGGGPVRVDNTEVLRAIAEIGARMDRFLNTDHGEIERIRVEIADIAGRINATKLEIAALRHPLEKESKFTMAAEELGTVVKSTEAATNSIMTNAEGIDEVIQELRGQITDGYQSSRLGDVADSITRIYEACNFQDLAGQRINKVVRTLAFIEERISVLMATWDERDLAVLPMGPDLIKQDGELKLNGPVAAQEQAISQADIDALFD